MEYCVSQAQGCTKNCWGAWLGHVNVTLGHACQAALEINKRNSTNCGKNRTHPTARIAPSSHTSGLRIGSLVVASPGAWREKVSTSELDQQLLSQCGSMNHCSSWSVPEKHFARRLNVKQPRSDIFPSPFHSGMTQIGRTFGSIRKIC